MYKIAVKKPDSTMEEKDIVLLSMGEYKQAVNYSLKYSNLYVDVSVAGNKKHLLYTQEDYIYFPNGLLFGGTAASAGLVTRGICGVTTPDAKGNCSKDSLYLNYDGNNDYSRPVVLGAGSAGNSITGGAHTYAAVRGDQMVSYVTSAIKGKANASHTHSIADVTDLQSTLDGKANKSDIPTIPTNYVTTNTDQSISSIKTFNAPLNSNGVEQATTIFRTANGGQIIFGKEGPNSGSMIGLDQVAGTRRLNFRASATPGAIVWSQPESGSSLFYDVANVYFRQTGYVAFNNASTINFGKFTDASALGTDANGNLKKVTLASVATSGKYSDLEGRLFTGYVTRGQKYGVQKDVNNNLYVEVPWTDNDTHQAVVDNDATLSWGSKTEIATIGSTPINVTLPANPHVIGKIMVGQANSVLPAQTGTTNDNTYIKYVENNYIRSQQKISGSGGIEVNSDISGNIAIKGSFAKVATSGQYSDLSGKPTIPDVSAASLTKNLGFGTYNIGHTWGLINSLAGYKVAWGADLPNGGGIAFGEANGKIYMQIDGDYYGDEGMRRLAYADELPDVSQESITKALGFTKTNLSSNWGTVNANNGYELIWTGVKTESDPTLQGEIILGEKEGRIHVQIDGDYYGDEGSKRVAYVDEIPDISGKADKSSLSAVATSGSYYDLNNRPTIPGNGTRLGTINGSVFTMGADLEISAPSSGFRHFLTFDNTTRSYNFGSGNRILIVTPYDSHALTIYSPSYTSLYSANTIMTTIHYTSWGIYYGNVSTGNTSSSSSYTQINIKCSGPCMVYVMDW